MALGFSAGFVALSLYLLPRLKGVSSALQWAKRMHGFGVAADRSPRAASDVAAGHADPRRGDGHPGAAGRGGAAGPDGPARRGGGVHAGQVRVPRRRGRRRRFALAAALPLDPAAGRAAASRRRPTVARRCRSRDSRAVGGDRADARPPRSRAPRRLRRPRLARLFRRRAACPDRGAAACLPRDHPAGTAAPVRRAVLSRRGRRSPARPTIYRRPGGTAHLRWLDLAAARALRCPSSPRWCWPKSSRCWRPRTPLAVPFFNHTAEGSHFHLL